MLYRLQMVLFQEPKHKSFNPIDICRYCLIASSTTSNEGIPQVGSDFGAVSNVALINIIYDQFYRDLSWKNANARFTLLILVTTTYFFAFSARN